MLFNILFVIFLLGTIILLIELIPTFYVWQSRIKIGRYTNDDIWERVVVKKALLWLKYTPKVKVKDNDKFIFLDIIRGKYSSKTIQSWQKASLVLGLNEYYKKNKNTLVKEKLKEFVEKNINKYGNWKNLPNEIDSCLLGFAFLQLDFIDIKMNKPAFDYLLQLVYKRIGEDGTVMYRKSMNDYRYVDTIGLVCPFLVKYGLIYNNIEAINLALKQIKDFTNQALLPNKIPSHAYELETGIPLGIFGWGRGFAWLSIGVWECYKLLPESHAEKQFLKRLLQEIAVTLKRYQKNDGAFSWNIFLKNERNDSSCTAVFALIFKELGMVDEFIKAKNYLKSVTRRNGAVDFSQGDTKGIGIYSQYFGILPFTQGFLVRILNANDKTS